MCGEKVPIDLCVGCHVGSPPHVRGKELHAVEDVQIGGITPACAGKSENDAGCRVRAQDHPRMCGEKTKKIP